MTPSQGVEFEDLDSIGHDLGRFLENLPVAMAVNRLDEPGTILFLNEQFVRLFGYSRAEIPTVEAWALQAYPDPAYRRDVFKHWDAAVGRARTGLVRHFRRLAARPAAAAMPMAARATLDGSGTTTAAKSLLSFTTAHTVRVLRSVPYTPRAVVGVAPGLAVR